MDDYLLLEHGEPMTAEQDLALIPKLVFRSRIDRWLAVLLFAAVAVCLAAAASNLWAGPLSATLPAALFTAVGAALPLWVLRTTRYTIRGETLHVRSGPFRWIVPIRGIRGVAHTRNPLSSPALSLHRLEIAYVDPGGRSRRLMISPRDEERFLRELQARGAAL